MSLIGSSVFGELIGFGALLLCSGGSGYFSKLLFNVLSDFKDPRIPRSSVFIVRKQLEFPVSMLLGLLFLYLGTFVVFPWDNWGSLFLSLKDIVQFVFNVTLFCVITFTLVRIAATIYAVSLDFSAFYKLGEHTVAVISEAIAIAGVMFVFFVSLILLASIFSPSNSAANTSTVTATVVALATRLNVISASFVIAASPVLRDIIAGLTVFSEGTVLSGDFIQVPGVLNEVGQVSRFRLRHMLVELKDRSLVLLPNRYLLAYPTINYTMSEKFVVQTSFKTLFSSTEKNRKVVALFEDGINAYLLSGETKLQKRGNNDIQSTVSLQRDDIISVKVVLKSKGFMENRKTKSELLLMLIELSQQISQTGFVLQTFHEADTNT